MRITEIVIVTVDEVMVRLVMVLLWVWHCGSHGEVDDITYGYGSVVVWDTELVMVTLDVVVVMVRLLIVTLVVVLWSWW